VVLVTDACIVTETPPLRAGWAPVGQRAEAPITGNRAKRTAYCALAVGTGSVRLEVAGGWNRETFQAHLRVIRATWRGWHVVLFLDRGGPHVATRTKALARALGIELRFLPTACPELNPVEGIWRHLKGRVPANEPTPDLDASVHRAFDDLRAMTGEERLPLAGVPSGNFWLPTWPGVAWLRELGFTLRIPRPSHPRAADPAARARWDET